MASDPNNYVIGRGKIHLEQYVDPTTQQSPSGNYMYLGNSPTFTITQAVTSLEHYSSDAGYKVLDESVDLQRTMTIAFTTDNVSIDNVASWFGGSEVVTAQTASTGLTQVNVVSPGSTVKLGSLATNPGGTFGIATTGFAVHLGSVSGTLIDPSNYYVDYDAGLVHFYTTVNPSLLGSVTISYGRSVYNETQIVGLGASIYGGLFYEATNPQGNPLHYTFPYLKLTPTGNLDLKGDTWQTLAFSGEVLASSLTGFSLAYVNGQTF